MDVVQGQITYRRAVSKKLVFYDLLCSHGQMKSAFSSQQGSSNKWVEVIVKLGTCGSSIQAIKDLRDSLKLGDTVAVTGSWEDEGHHVMQAVSVSVLQAWREQHPTTAFTPQPSPLSHHAEQPPRQRQAQQQQQQQQQQQRASHDTEVQGSATADAGAADVTGIEAATPPAQLLPPAVAAGLAPSSTAAAGPSAATDESGRAVLVQEAQLPVCKFWVNTGRCGKGAACPYAHLMDCRRTWVRQRRGQRQLLSSSLGFSHEGESAAAKRQRAQLFAAWLVDTFGKEALNAGAGVLDVAGGAGGMTFELSVVHGIKCTLIDPRPLKLNKQQHKALEAAGRAALLTSWTAEQLQQGCCLATTQTLKQHKVSQQPPEQQQRKERSHSTDDEEQHKAGNHADSQLQPHRQCSQLQPQQQQEHRVVGQQGMDQQLQRHQAADLTTGIHSPVQQFAQVQGWFGQELWQSRGFQQVFGSCSLVIGLHPDEATEHIVDYALEAGVPFAVVPCCVFPRLFPDRRLQQAGQLVPVTSYAELVNYLTAKGQAQRDVLGFVGANVVVYRQA